VVIFVWWSFEASWCTVDHCARWLWWEFIKRTMWCLQGVCRSWSGLLPRRRNERIGNDNSVVNSLLYALIKKRAELSTCDLMSLLLLLFEQWFEKCRLKSNNLANLEDRFRCENNNLRMWWSRYVCEWLWCVFHFFFLLRISARVWWRWVKKICILVVQNVGQFSMHWGLNTSTIEGFRSFPLRGGWKAHWYRVSCASSVTDWPLCGLRHRACTNVTRRLNTSHRDFFPRKFLSKNLGKYTKKTRIDERNQLVQLLSIKLIVFRSYLESNSPALSAIHWYLPWRPAYEANKFWT